MKRLTRVALDEILALALASVDLFNGAKIGLYKTSVPLNADTVLADLTKCNFTGYADTVVVMTAGVDGVGEPILSAPPTVFTPMNAANLPQNAVGAFITNAAGDLLAAGEFAAPLQILFADQPLHVTAKIDIESEQPATFEAGFP